MARRDDCALSKGLEKIPGHFTPDSIAYACLASWAIFIDGALRQPFDATVILIGLKTVGVIGDRECLSMSPSLVLTSASLSCGACLRFKKPDRIRQVRCTPILTSCCSLACPMASNRPPYHGLKRKLVLAIDLGTTYSGISYAILDPGKAPEIKTVTRSVLST